MKMAHSKEFACNAGDLLAPESTLGAWLDLALACYVWILPLESNLHEIHFYSLDDVIWMFSHV